MAGHPADSPENLIELPSVECPEPAEGLFWVYILECRNGTFYTGHTANVLSRINRHLAGSGARHTKLLTPLRLVYVEGPVDAAAAIIRERQLKKWSRGKKIALIEGRFADLKRLSASRNA